MFGGLVVWRPSGTCGACYTYGGDDKNSEENSENVAENVYHHDGEESHGQVKLALSLVILTAT